MSYAEDWMGRSDRSSSAAIIMVSRIIDEALEGFQTLGAVRGTLDKIEGYILLMTVLLYITVGIVGIALLIYLLVKLLNNRRSPPMSLIGHENNPSLAGSQQILYAVNPKTANYQYNPLRGSPGPGKPHTIVQIPPPPMTTSASKSFHNIPHSSNSQTGHHDRIMNEDEEEMCILTSMTSSIDKDSLRMLVERDEPSEHEHPIGPGPSTSTAGLLTNKSTRFQVNEEIV